MKYIYVVTFNARLDGITIHKAYESRRKAYRIANELRNGEVIKTEVIEKKFERLDHSNFVPKKNSDPKKRKKRK